MFYLIRAKTATSAISIGRDNDPAKIASTILELQQAGFADISVLDASGREVALDEIDRQSPVSAESPETFAGPVRP